MTSNDPQPSQSQPSRELGWKARACCAVVGAAAGVAGVIGIFTKDASSIGVPVLLALAAFFGYVAVSGQRLTSIKLGDYEAAFERIADVVTRRVLQNPGVPDEAKGDVAAALDVVRPDLPARTRRAVDASLNLQRRAQWFQRQIQDMLHREFPDQYVGEVRVTDDVWDAVLELAPDKRLVVSTVWREDQISTQNVLPLVSAVLEAPPRYYDYLLLVSNRQLGPSDFERLAERAANLAGLKSLIITHWSGPQDDETLVETIRKLQTESSEDETAE